MKAMILEKICSLQENTSPLTLVEMAPPVPHGEDLLVKVSACGVCHTELDEIEGRTPPPTLPMIPGHQVVGRVHGMGPDTHRYTLGDRVGVAWIFSACGTCRFCSDGYENLCEGFQATGRDAHGGYAEYMTVSERFVYRIPDLFSDMEAAPLLCAGAIGYRSLHLTNLAIRKETSDQGCLLELDYASHLWLEKEIKSVANVTRQDVKAFLALADDMRIRPEVQEFALAEANQALVELKERKIRGAKVLVMDR